MVEGGPKVSGNVGCGSSPFARSFISGVVVLFTGVGGAGGWTSLVSIAGGGSVSVAGVVD